MGTRVDCQGFVRRVRYWLLFYDGQKTFLYLSGQVDLPRVSSQREEIRMRSGVLRVSA